jgi:hypothetical protein
MRPVILRLVGKRLTGLISGVLKFDQLDEGIFNGITFASPARRSPLSIEKPLYSAFERFPYR